MGGEHSESRGAGPDEKEDRRESHWGIGWDLVLNCAELVMWLLSGIVRLMAWVLAALAGSCS